jgi:membrane protein implicated in regulation of membrane protease activity
MMGLLEHVEFWHWWVLGVVLLILEVFAPGAFFLWLAIAAAVVGLVVMAMPAMAWDMQLLVFAVLSVAAVVLGRLWLKRHPIVTDRPMLNRRGDQYVGRVFTLDEPVINGFGKIRVDDTTWKIRGDDCAAGARIRVVGVDGTTLLVDAAD